MRKARLIVQSHWGLRSHHVVHRHPKASAFGAPLHRLQALGVESQIWLLGKHGRLRLQGPAGTLDGESKLCLIADASTACAIQRRGGENKNKNQKQKKKTKNHA